jgi:hypothetical protein
MGNYVMQVDFFGNNVRAETSGNLVCLNDLITAGNAWRVVNGLSARKLADITTTDSFKNFVASVSKIKSLPVESLFFATGRGRNSRTMGHLIVAIYVAEQMSPEFHVNVIDTFVSGKLLEFRELGGTEFKNLNAAIDLYLPDRASKDNTGVYINVAKLIRLKLLGAECAEGWNAASIAQIHSRYDVESKLVSMLKLGVVNDYKHLCELIQKI